MPIPFGLPFLMKLVILSTIIMEFLSKKNGRTEEADNRFAEDCLIPPKKYQDFLAEKNFNLQTIKTFVNQIERDPGIVLGRLQNDEIIDFDDWTMHSLRHKYKVKIAN